MGALIVTNMSDCSNLAKEPFWYLAIYHNHAGINASLVITITVMFLMTN